MDSLLVISDEPALAETLASELPGVTVEHARLDQTPPGFGEEHYRLMVIDEGIGTHTVLHATKTPVIRLTRPVRLAELLYTIQERLQGKSAPGRDELALSEGLLLSPSERMVRSEDGRTQIALTEKETELLQCLLAAGGAVVPRDRLLKTVWGYHDDIATHTIETHIYRLRGKLRQTNESLDVLSSDEGGYRLKT